MSIDVLTAKWAELYRSYGYQNYAMSKFEEYELYLRNKDFLISDRVLTFTDTDGKLMALKPDVTLSIIKNTANSRDGLQKICYQEHVYRPGKSDQGFREIPQVGLECMGKLDSYCIFEVLLLAVKSLKAIKESCVLDVSHMGLLARLLDSCGLTGQLRQQVLEAIGSKNATASAPYAPRPVLTAPGWKQLPSSAVSLQRCCRSFPGFCRMPRSFPSCRHYWRLWRKPAGIASIWISP